MDSLSRQWGEDSIHLQLPASFLTIEGLSRDQRRIIGRDYAGFIVSPGNETHTSKVICHAQRLDRPIGLPLEHFSVNGLYTPRKLRAGKEIQITGFNFMARIDRSGVLPAQAVLAVAKEKELASSNVIENFLRILLAHHVLDRGGVMLHSAGILHGGRTFLFCGRSDAGKTTLACKASQAGARVLSDDINLVIPESGRFMAHKVPFTGEFGRWSENRSGCGFFPIGALALLEKAPNLFTIPACAAEAVAWLLTGCPFVNDDSKELQVLLDVLIKLVADTPIVRLGVGRDDSFGAVMNTLLRHCEDDRNNRY